MAARYRRNRRTAELSDVALECRVNNHHWTNKLFARRGRYFECIDRCITCKTERVRILSLGFEVQASRYRYPEGFLTATKGEGRVSQPEVYREKYSRSDRSAGSR